MEYLHGHVGQTVAQLRLEHVVGQRCIEIWSNQVDSLAAEENHVALYIVAHHSGRGRRKERFENGHQLLAARGIERNAHHGGAPLGPRKRYGHKTRRHSLSPFGIYGHAHPSGGDGDLYGLVDFGGGKGLGVVVVGREDRCRRRTGDRLRALLPFDKVEQRGLRRNFGSS